MESGLGGMQRIVKAWTHRRQHRAFIEWVAVVEHMHRQEGLADTHKKHGEHLKKMHHMTKMQRAESIIKHLAHKTLAHGWNSWVARVMAMEAMESGLESGLALTQRIVKAWTHRRQHRAFIEWVAVVKELELADTHKKHGEHLKKMHHMTTTQRAKSIILHLAHKTLVHGWNSWVARVMAMEAMESGWAVMQRIVKAWTHRRQHRA